LVEHEGDGKGRQERRNPGRVLKRPQREALNQHAEYRRSGHRKRNSSEERQPGAGRRVGKERAQHQERALGEVDEVRHAEDQREADRHERIDIADHEAVEDLAEELDHDAPFR
jgi:hypothetical protein